MGAPADISQAIIEALYAKALVLADEVRATFTLRGPGADFSGHAGGTGPDGADEDPLRAALSEEGLRATTRMMHVLAWLLNQRAFLAGEISEFQLRRHGALPEDRPADPDMLVMLDLRTQELIEETEALHSRVARLDRAWRMRFEMRPAAIMRLRARLGMAVTGERRRFEREALR